jgi:hypothetical protein
MTCAQPVPVVWSEKFTLICPCGVQLSLTVGLPVSDGVGGVPNGMAAAGGQEMSGGSSSTKVMVWVQDAALPA